MFALIIPVLCVSVTEYTNKSKHANPNDRTLTSTGAKNDNTKISGKIVVCGKDQKQLWVYLRKNKYLWRYNRYSGP